MLSSPRCCFVFILLTSAGKVAAHPLGNFSISQYSAIRINGNEIELRYIIDMAEIPTFQEIQESGIVPQGGRSQLWKLISRARAELLRDGLTLEVNGQRLPLSSGIQGNYFSARRRWSADDEDRHPLQSEARRAIRKTGEYLLSYRDNNFLGRAGWKEIIAVAAPGAGILNSSVPEADRSSQLNNYPTDLLNSPPQELEAKVAFTTAATTCVRCVNGRLSGLMWALQRKRGR